jgi:hypothetical protein
VSLVAASVDVSDFSMIFARACPIMWAPVRFSAAPIGSKVGSRAAAPDSGAGLRSPPHEALDPRHAALDCPVLLGIYETGRGIAARTVAVRIAQFAEEGFQRLGPRGGVLAAIDGCEIHYHGNWLWGD